ncbi:metallophosphoesterase family protein [Dactylosporangium darangshiense]|uniref:Metallophosphoesterase n=1 Tax=Dactylosporangium darangshiense TaxID=579108 RepID=A0ABP8D769_9ACTN
MTAPIIAHLSDLHFGAHDPAAVQSLAGDVIAARPDLVIVTGDLTMRARERQFAQARAFLDRLPGPRLVIPGNHDLAATPGRLLDPHRRYRAHLGADLEPRLEVPGLRALGLASTPRWRWKNGRVSRAQRDGVAAYLGAAGTGAGRVLALHHPPYGGPPGRLLGLRSLASTLEAARVDLVLAGHTHLPADAVVVLPSGRRLLQVVAGSATSTRLRGTPRSWTAITVGPGEFRVEVRVERDGAWHRGRVATHPR